MATNPAVADACCTLNLLATGREQEILEALGMTIIVPERVRAEIRFLWTAPDENNVRHRVPVDIESLLTSGLFEIMQLANDQYVDAFVEAAALITDSDASCIALAGVSGSPLISDDGKERRIARSLFPNIRLISTLELLNNASTALSWDQNTLVEVATSLRWRGNFAAPRKDPLAQWYTNLLRNTNRTAR